MKFWTTGIFMALGALFPTLAFSQDPWGAYGAPAGGYYDPAHSGMACPPSVYEQLLPERGDLYDGNSRFGLTFREAFAESYVRLDYMHWFIKGGNGALLGAPVAPSIPGTPPPDLTGNDRNNMLPANDPITGLLPATSVIVPSLDNHFDNVNGLRGTIGIPTEVGTFEAEIFYFEQKNNTIRIDPFVDTQSPSSSTTTIAGTTLLVNGNLSPNRMILYNAGYEAIQRTSFWGSELNWIYKPFTPNVPVEVSPILGFRYLSLDETLTISGTNIQSSTVTLNHLISSMARNNIYGPQLGLKAATMLGPRMEVGLETKFVAGINSLDEYVKTQEIFNPTTSTDPNQTLEAPRNITNSTIQFSPIFDLAVTGKFQVSPHFKLFASYEFLLGANFQRAFDNIYYDSPSSVTSPPTIRLKSDNSSFMAHGFAVGGEFVFR